MSSGCRPPASQCQSLSSTATSAPLFHWWMLSKHCFMMVEYRRFFSQYVLPNS